MNSIVVICKPPGMRQSWLSYFKRNGAAVFDEDRHKALKFNPDDPRLEPFLYEPYHVVDLFPTSTESILRATKERRTKSREKALTSVLTYIRKDWSNYLATSNLDLFIERMKRSMDDADHALLTPPPKREAIKKPKPDGISHDLLTAAQDVLDNWSEGDLAGAVRELAAAVAEEEEYRRRQHKDL